MRGVLLPRGPTALALPGSQTFVPVNQLVVPDGLVGYYSCGYDGIADLLYLLDATPFHNNGALAGTTKPKPVTRDGIGALSFDGATSYVNLLDSNNFGLGDFSVSLLVNPTGFAAINHEIALIHKAPDWDTGAGWAIELATYGGSTTACDAGVYFSTAANGPGSSGNIIAINRWSNVILTRVGTTARLYVNGELANSYTAVGVGGTVTNANNLVVGEKNVAWQNEYFNGLISDIRLYNRALDVAEAREIYAAGIAGRRVNQAVGQWPALRALTTTSMLVPDADSIDGSWTNETGGTTLYASIDETSFDDADYIISSGNPVSDVCKISLSNPAAGVTTPFTVSYRYKKQGSGAINLLARLLEGSTQIVEWTHVGISATYSTATQTLSGGEVAAIGDPTNLFLEFEAAMTVASDYAVLLLHCDGPNASTTFTDAMGRHTCTGYINAKNDTGGQIKFGAGAGISVGAGAGADTSSISIADNLSDLTFGTGDFTIDFWIYPTTAPAAATSVPLVNFAPYGGSGGVYPYVGFDNTRKLYYYTTSTRIAGTTVISLNAWHHIALTRSGTNTRLFVDGTQDGSTWTADSTDYSLPVGELPAFFGERSAHSGYSFDGYFDEIRILKGAAAWTANFTPPTAAY